MTPLEAPPPLVGEPKPAGVRQAKSHRIGELDALRGIAAIAVVFHHLTRRFYEDFGMPAGAVPSFPVSGMHGVFLFFIISGFVISQTLERIRSAKEFAISRFSRIFPSFWTCVLLTFGIVHAFGLPGREVGFGPMLINLTMLQDHLHVSQVDYVYWSLTIELTFYVLAYLAHAAGWLSRHPHGAAWGWLAVTGAYAAARLGFGYELHENVQLLTLPRYAPLFVAGMMFYLLRGGRGTWQTHVIVAACFILHNLVNPYGKTGYVLSAGMFGVFYLLVFGRMGFLRARPLLFLGAISYPLYLLHNNIGMVMIRELMAAGLHYNVALAAAILGIVGLSTGVMLLVEKPAMRWMRSRWAAKA